MPLLAKKFYNAIKHIVPPIYIFFSCARSHLKESAISHISYYH